MDPMVWLLKNRYGSLELSRQVGPNLLRGLAGSVFLHAFAVTALFVLAMVNAGDHSKVGKLPEGPIIILPKFAPMQLPPIRPELTKPTPPDVVTNPVPVNFDPAEPQTPDLPKGEFGVPGPVELPGTGTGPINIPPGEVGGIPDDVIPPQEVFIPFEVPPAALDINPQPAYPELARVSGLSGKVILNVYVNKQGDVRKWEIISADPKGLGFEDEVLKVIPKWKFTPAIQQGKPVGVWVGIPFKFKIER